MLWWVNPEPADVSDVVVSRIKDTSVDSFAWWYTESSPADVLDVVVSRRCVWKGPGVDRRKV